MVKESNNKIGCCYLTFKQVNDPWYGSLITCNYGKTNILTQSVYTKGEPATECSDWGDDYQSSIDYPYLCEHHNQVPVDIDTTTMLTTMEMIVKTTMDPDVASTSDYYLSFDSTTTEAAIAYEDAQLVEENELITKTMSSSSKSNTMAGDKVNEEKYKNIESRFSDSSEFNLISSLPESEDDSSRNVTDYCEIEKVKCGGMNHIGCNTDFEVGYPVGNR